MIKVNLNNTKISNDDLKDVKKLITKSHEYITKENGKGSEWLGWKDWPTNFNKDEIKSIKNKINDWDSKGVDTLLVIGIGGSYLGAKAAIDFIKGTHDNSDKEVIFVGTNLSADYINSVIKKIENKNWAINIISKSGTTLEPAVSFRIFRQLLEEKHGSKANRYIAAVTSGSTGTLYNIAKKEEYDTYVIPDNIGGRYSVTTPVGLFAMQFMGINIDNVMKGSAKAQKELLVNDIDKNPAYKYAAAKHILSNGKNIELYVNYDPRMTYLSEWIKQLHGESQGKDGKGIFPASVTNSADLHSLGQFIQDGSKVLFETVIWSSKERTKLKLPKSKSNDDNLNFLAGKDLSWINEQAFKGVVKAHYKDAGVDNIILDIKDFSEETLGYLIYFFFVSVAMSCYMIDVNPFDQPGVEIYKSYMKDLLNK
ncbi:MAG: glucose-6-phosphate isomerase [Mycoplasmataceae bacterium]|nr:glucose-6-phosphate isomerase [Mycoplasmataceae bacterium]